MLKPGLITDMLAARELHDCVFDDVAVVGEALAILCRHTQLLALYVLFRDCDHYFGAAILSVARMDVISCQTYYQKDRYLPNRIAQCSNLNSSTVDLQL